MEGIGRGLLQATIPTSAWRSEKSNEEPQSGWSVPCQFSNQARPKDKAELLLSEPTKANLNCPCT
jgi:hypothetical protein